MSFEAIGQVLGTGMGGLGGGLLGGGAGGLTGAGTGAVEGGEAGAVVGLAFPPAEPETIGLGAAGGAVVGGATGAITGGYRGAIIGAQRGRSILGAAGRALDHVFNSTSKADEEAKAVPDEATDQTCQQCKDPCKDLRTGKGAGFYRGGAHSRMKITDPERLKGVEYESHHMPGDSASQEALGGKLPRDSGPAIQMLKPDHRLTRSVGRSADAKKYQTDQADLIRRGRYMEAFDNDAADVRRVAREAGDPGRYDEAIKEAQDYAECVEKNRVRKILNKDNEP